MLKSDGNWQKESEKNESKESLQNTMFKRPKYQL